MAGLAICGLMVVACGGALDGRSKSEFGALTPGRSADVEREVSDGPDVAIETLVDGPDGESDTEMPCPDDDEDGVPDCLEIECGLGNPKVAPGLAEVCDRVDNDCDGETDEGLDCPCGLLGAPCPAGFACEWQVSDLSPYSGFCVSAQGDEVWIPDGSFWMGCNSTHDLNCNSDELPQHRVGLAAHAIDRHEVTVAEYGACVAARACTLPDPQGGELDNYTMTGGDKHPINYADWTQAAAFCAWKSRRLCTEAEWERAARGGCETLGDDCRSGMRVYPWGESPPGCDLANSVGCGDRTWEVGSTPAGSSPYGVEDMSGDVWEWLSDWYAPDYYAVTGLDDPRGSERGQVRCARGGSFANSVTNLRSSVRFYDWPEAVWDDLGIRCCRSL